MRTQVDQTLVILVDEQRELGNSWSPTRSLSQVKKGERERKRRKKQGNREKNIRNRPVTCIYSVPREIGQNRRWKLTSRNISEIVCFPLFERDAGAPTDLYNVRITGYRVAVNVNRLGSHRGQLLADLILPCHARHTSCMHMGTAGDYLAGKMQRWFKLLDTSAYTSPD